MEDQEIFVCMYSDVVLEDQDEVYYILDGYVLAGYENDYCHSTFGISYEELFEELNEWDEEEEDWIIGDEVYYTTIAY